MITKPKTYRKRAPSASDDDDLDMKPQALVVPVRTSKAKTTSVSAVPSATARLNPQARSNAKNTLPRLTPSLQDDPDYIDFDFDSDEEDGGFGYGGYHFRQDGSVRGDFDEGSSDEEMEEEGFGSWLRQGKKGERKVEESVPRVGGGSTVNIKVDESLEASGLSLGDWLLGGAGSKTKKVTSEGSTSTEKKVRFSDVEVPRKQSLKSTQPAPPKRFNSAYENDSDDEETTPFGETDDLYDPEADDADELWMSQKLGQVSLGLGSDSIPPAQEQQPPTNAPASQKPTQPIPNLPPDLPTDGTLSCPGCFTNLTYLCQRHERYKNQYRALFVVEEVCEVVKDEVLRVQNPPANKKSKNAKKNKTKQAKARKGKARAKKVEGVVDEDGTGSGETATPTDTINPSESTTPTSTTPSPSAKATQPNPKSHTPPPRQTRSHFPRNDNDDDDDDDDDSEEDDEWPREEDEYEEEDEEKEEGGGQEVYHPVRCGECRVEVAVVDAEEIYHFFNVIFTPK